MRLYRTRALLLIGLAGCDGTAPKRSIEGVWGARVALFSPTDSLTIALGQQGSEIRGFAILRRIEQPSSQYMDMYNVRGTLVGQAADLLLTPTSGLSTIKVLATLATFDHDLSGTATTINGDIGITLRRVDPKGNGVAGTHALVSTSGAPAGTSAAVRDTILALPDGRGRRHREEEGFGYGTLTMWRRSGDWLFVEQFRFFSTASIPYLDSMRIQGDALVRNTKLYDGSSIIETYARVAAP
jgi:hypothetical protein